MPETQREVRCTLCNYVMDLIASTIIMLCHIAARHLYIRLTDGRQEHDVSLCMCQLRLNNTSARERCRKSAVWSYFELMPELNPMVKCELCDYRTRFIHSTSHMIAHIMANHPHIRLDL